MNKLKILALFFSMFFLYGCTSGAQFANMAYMDSPVLKYDKELKNDVGVSSVEGGEETNPLWISKISNENFRKAVRLTLSSQGLLSEHGRYQLKVKLKDVEQPMFGLDMEVTTHVEYILMDTKTNKVVMDDTIVAPYTATFSDAPLGMERMRLANEGSGKKNIEGFLKKLSHLNISASKVSMAN